MDRSAGENGTVLYRPETFEPLTEDPWQETPVREAIRRIVEDADAAFDPDALWPADEWDAWQASVPLKNLYVGAAGVVWALDVLRRRGLAETKLDLASVARRTLEAWREAGPPGIEKGPCICHGTAGNGYAFLKAFERTATRNGSSEPAASRRTRSVRSSAANGVATHSSRATSGSRSSRPTASMREARIRSSTPGINPLLLGDSRAQVALRRDGCVRACRSGGAPPRRRAPSRPR